MQNRIREIRESKGLLPREVAAMIGCDRSTISRLETGKRAVTQQDLVQIAKALGVDPIELITDARVAKTDDARDLLDILDELPPDAVNALLATARALMKSQR